MPSALYPAARPQAIYSTQEAQPALTYDQLVEDGQTSRGLRSTLLGMGAAGQAGDYYRALADSNPTAAKQSGLRAQQLSEEAAAAAPRVQSVSQINGVSDVPDYLAGQLGAAGPGLVTPVLGGLAGAALGRFGGPAASQALGMAGGLGAMFPSMKDAAVMQHIQAQKAEPTPQQATQALNESGWQAAAETVPYALLGAPTLTAPGRLMGGKTFIPQAKSFGGAMARGAALQGAAGAGSVAIGQQFRDAYDSTRDHSGDATELLDAGVSNALIGVPFEAAGHAGQVAHSGAAAGLDLGGKALKLVGGKAGDAAQQAWAARPKTLDEAAVMAGEGAAKLHGKAEDVITRVMQRGKDADVDVLLAPRLKNATVEDLQADYGTRHQAADSFVKRVEAQPDAYPEFVREAAQKYTNSSRLMDTWSTVSDAVNDWKRGEDVGQAFSKFAQEAGLKAGETAGKLHNAFDDAMDVYRVSRAVDGRANAQTPAMRTLLEESRDELSPLLDKALLPHLGVKNPAAVANELPWISHGMREWVKNDFSLGRGSELKVPDKLLDMFTDPKAAVTAVVDLMHRQGEVGDEILQHSASVLHQLDVKKQTRMDVGSIVDDNLLPTKNQGLSAADHDRIGADLMDRLSRDEVKTAEIKELFGPRAKVVLDALHAKLKAEREEIMRGAELDGRERTAGARVDENGDVAENAGQKMAYEGMGQITNATKPNEVLSETAHHFYRPERKGGVDKETGEIKEAAPAEPFKVGHTRTYDDGYKADHDKTAATHIADLQAKNSSTVTRQGYLDHLREVHAGDAEAFGKEIIGFMQRKDAEIRDLTDKHVGSGAKKAPSPEDIINKNWYVLREDKRGIKGERTNAHADDFKSVGPRSTWGESTRGELGTTAHGRLWLERVNADGTRTEFATSTSRLVTRMAAGRKSEGNAGSDGISGQEGLVKQGLASLLATRHPEGEAGKYGKSPSAGEPVLSGRVGYKDKATDTVTWLKAGEDLPDSLRMHSTEGLTFKDAKTAVRAERDAATVRDAKALIEQFENKAAERGGELKNDEATFKADAEDAIKRRDMSAVYEAMRSWDSKRDALRYERDDATPIGADTYETKPTKRTDVIQDKAGHNFGSKKLALESAKEGDRVVRRGKGWVIERDVADTSRQHTDLPTEISEMGKTSNIRSLAEDSTGKVRNFDETTGEALHPTVKAPAKKAEVTEPAVAKVDVTQVSQKADNTKQAAYVLNKLRAGEGEFAKAVDGMTYAQRVGVAGQLAQMLKANKTDAMWGGKPPLDMAAFKARGERALAKLETYLGSHDEAGRKLVKPVEAAPSVKPTDTPSAKPTDTLDQVIERHQDYLDNPPADYTTEKARAIGEWGANQLKRLDKAILDLDQTRNDKSKEFDSDRDDQLRDWRGDVKRLVAKAKLVLEGDESLKAFEGAARENKQAPKEGMLGAKVKEPASAEELAKFHADVARRLGPGVESVLKEELWGKSRNGRPVALSGEWTQGVIRASVYARSLSQVGAHESFHEFFSRMKDQPQAAEVMKLLDRAANSPYVKRQLERLLDGETAALKQIADGAKHSAEERMAYMFQFHQAGLLKIGPETETVFAKIARVFRRIAGLMSDDERADMLLRSFDKGEMQTPDAAARVLANSVTARAQMYSAVNKAFVPVMDRVSRAVNTTETNLKRTGIKEYDEIRRLFKRSVGEDGAQGFLDAKDHMMKQWSNRLATVFDGKEIKDLELAAPYLLTGKKPTDPVVKDIVAKLTGPDGLLPAMHKYLTEAGVMRWDDNGEGKGQWVPMGKIKENYYPHAYDTAKILGDTNGFIEEFAKLNANELNKIAAGQNELLAKSGGEGYTPVTAVDVARGITNRLINSFGSTLGDNSSDLTVGGKAALKESAGSVGFSPFMQSVNKRDLHWIHPDLLAKWGEKDIAKTMTSYVAQGIKRAEYVRRFGNGGEVLKAKLEAAYEANLKKLTDSGMAKGDAMEKALKTAKGAATDVMAMEGTLGYGINPKLRKFENSMLVYENMRVLSTSLFSQFIDPLGLIVRGGTMGDAWESYKRGIREVVASIKGDPIKDLDSMIADQVGTTDANGFLAAFGQLYSSQYMGASFRKANDALFKYNGMEGFNRGMQVSATRTAINFIKRHVEKPNERSESYLKELNLKASDVAIDPKTGELDYTDPTIQRAIHQWVNGAIMRPNAAQRPAWGSDPHYMVFWHMKQFAYTFHDVIMKRAQYEYTQFGDMGPAGLLALAYTPVMIGTDALKGVLLSGGDEPGWMKAGLGSEIQHGAMRAGLAGKFQPGVDVLGPNRSLLGLGGPVVEQLTQMFHQAPGDAAINALPGANVWNTMRGGNMVEMQGED